jgi:hypothetical protein
MLDIQPLRKDAAPPRLAARGFAFLMRRASTRWKPNARRSRTRTQDA